MKGVFIFLFFAIKYTNEMEIGSYIGCYKYEGKQDVIPSIPSVQDCINSCENKNVKFAALSDSNTTCFCTNFLGELGNSNSPNNCNEISIYSSQRLIPGPPKNFQITTVTEEDVQISWGKPDNVEVIKYEISANVLHTFSHNPMQNGSWIYSNNTFQTALKLHSASKYNISICARSSAGLGRPASKIIETLVGIPDNIPSPPEVLSRDGSRMTVKVHPVISNNGPINYYRVIVLNEAARQIFQPDYLKNYQESLEDHFNYYITAELTPEDIKKNFIVGDAKYYGDYFNAPLVSTLNYNLITGVVSKFNNVTKVAYSNSSRIYRGIHVLDVESSNSSKLVVTLLTIAIVVLVILLIIGIVGFFILHRYVKLRHRHNRLSDQELTLQGPMICVENSVYIPEAEQIEVNHYRNLKQRVRILSLKDEISVDAHSIIGRGKFGVVCNAVLRENNDYIPLAAYTIPDKSLVPEQKKIMLKELDMLIKYEKHNNLIELVGTSESSHMLYVLLKIFPMNLKQFLISNRILLPNRFCKASESQILGIITQIAHGLAELEKNRIYHQKLCARNIMLTDNLVPKIFGFGLADYVTEEELDYTRWTAVEVLKGLDFNSRSPIWSFGTLLWEVCALGATPYNNISNIPELIDKVSRGIRLPQLKYFNDDVYQLMLSCWQVDMGERPDSEALCRVIENLHEDTIIPFISFNLYHAFEYEQYKPEFEFKSY